MKVPLIRKTVYIIVEPENTNVKPFNRNNPREGVLFFKYIIFIIFNDSEHK